MLNGQLHVVILGGGRSLPSVSSLVLQKRKWGNRLAIFLLVHLRTYRHVGARPLFRRHLALGFVAALLLGSILCMRYAMLWVYRNVLIRHLCTPCAVPREQESTPVLNGSKLAASFPKQKINSSRASIPQEGDLPDVPGHTALRQFALSLWASQGSLLHVCRKRRLEELCVDVLLYKGEMNKMAGVR